MLRALIISVMVTMAFNPSTAAPTKERKRKSDLEKLIDLCNAVCNDKNFYHNYYYYYYSYWYYDYMSTPIPGDSKICQICKDSIGAPPGTDSATGPTLPIVPPEGPNSVPDVPFPPVPPADETISNPLPVIPPETADVSVSDSPTNAIETKQSSPPEDGTAAIQRGSPPKGGKKNSAPTS